MEIPGNTRTSQHGNEECDNPEREAMMIRRRFLSVLAGAVLGLNAADEAIAQAYPQRTVKIIVAGVPGVPFDIIARIIADKLSTSLKHTFVVENRPGAAGNIGAEVVARSAPDGHTLLVALGTAFTVNPTLYRKLPYDPEADFRPITILAMSSNMLVVHPSVPVNSVAELVAHARKEPISYAHGGNGSPGHLTMEYFRLQAGFETNPVPYRGNAPLVTDLVSGQIKFAFAGIPGVAPHVRDGRLKGFAVSSDRRSALAPDVPTMPEVGYPDFKVESYYVLMAPAGIPDSVAALLEREVREALTSPDQQEKFRTLDIVPALTTAAEAKARIEADRKLWAGVIKAADMRAD
jgi:tripartite-type tricarboxylate transporter receptor subunit TctC